MGEERLQRLRRRIRNLDAAILGRAAERMELAREIGETKRRLEIPLRDFEVEREVLERAAEELTGWIERGEEAAFESAMREARARLGGPPAETRQPG